MANVSSPAPGTRQPRSGTPPTEEISSPTATIQTMSYRSCGPPTASASSLVTPTATCKSGYHELFFPYLLVYQKIKWYTLSQYDISKLSRQEGQNINMSDAIIIFENP